MSSPLSAFTAVPNPQMLAFMGAQSFIMMFQAGEGWQYGKRRISAMTNEDFNKLTPERLLQNQAATLRSSISTIEKSMNDMTPMIKTIISQYGDFLREIIAEAPKALLKGTGGTSPQDIVDNFFDQQELHNHPETDTESTRQVLSDFIKSILNPLPSAGGHIQTTTATTGSGGSRTIGATLNAPTSAPSKIFRGFQVPTITSAPRSKLTLNKSIASPHGGPGGSIKAQLQNKINVFQSSRSQFVRQQALAQKQMTSRHSSERSAGQNNFDRARRQLTEIDRRIRLLKTQIARLR